MKKLRSIIAAAALVVLLLSLCACKASIPEATSIWGLWQITESWDDEESPYKDFNSYMSYVEEHPDSDMPFVVDQLQINDNGTIDRIKTVYYGGQFYDGYLREEDWATYMYTSDGTLTIFLDEGDEILSFQFDDSAFRCKTLEGEITLTQGRLQKEILGDWKVSDAQIIGNIDDADELRYLQEEIKTLTGGEDYTRGLSFKEDGTVDSYFAPSDRSHGQYSRERDIATYVISPDDTLWFCVDGDVQAAFEFDGSSLRAQIEDVDVAFEMVLVKDK